MIRLIVEKALKRLEKKDKDILNSQTIPEGITEDVDIPYIDDEHKGHMLDIYYPEGTKERLPVVITIHGGGFVYGDKSLNKLYGYYLAKRGFIVFNINYRLALRDTRVYGQMQDIVAAVNWIGDNLDSYMADREKVFIVGDSVGGMLTVLTALVPKSEKLRQAFKLPDLNLNIQAIASISGMMCINESKIYYRGWRRLCFDKGYKNQEYYKNMIFDGNPDIKYLPPTFLSTSDEDELHRMTLSFTETLKKYDVKHKLKYFTKREDRRLGHIFSVLYPTYEESAEQMDEMLDFFNEAVENKG